MRLMTSPGPAPHSAPQRPLQPLAEKTANVLIVEDQSFDRMRLVRMCQSLAIPITLTEAPTLAAMIKKLAQDRFDLVLLDYHLPDGTGLQGIDMLRESFLNRNAASIMITGTAEAHVASDALNLGFNDCLRKDDLTADTLRRALVSALQTAKNPARITLDETAIPQANEMLHRFSRDCAQEIKPLVSRMMRQLRALRRLPPAQAQDKVTELETSCGQLWRFLNDLERFGGAAPPDSKSPRPRSAKPPSPFSRRDN